MWIKPRLWISDESEYWSEDIIKKAGKIYGIYLYDSEYRIHICSFQASNEIYALGVEYSGSDNYYNLTDKEQEELYDEIQIGWSDGTELVGYMDAHYDEHKNNYPLKSVQCKKDEYDDIWKDIVEAYTEALHSGSLDVWKYIKEMEKINEV